MAALATTQVAMISPKAMNSPILVSSILLNTEAYPNEPYHNRSVHTLVKTAKTTIRTATMTKVGRMALRRRPTRRLLTLISPQPLLHHSSNQQRPRWSERFRGAYAPDSCQRMRMLRRHLGIGNL